MIFFAGLASERFSAISTALNKRSGSRYSPGAPSLERMPPSRMKQLRARKQRIVARENAKARKRRTHLIIRLGGILSNEGVLGYDEGVWNDEGNRQRLLDMLKAHAAELRAWASDAGVRLPSAESAGELREQVRDLPQEPQIQEQPGYGYQPGFQQPQQWQQQPWN